MFKFRSGAKSICANGPGPKQDSVVDEIIRLKSQMLWNGARAVELAAKYGIEIETIGRAIAEANRVLRVTFAANQEDARALVVSALQSAIDEARRDGAHAAVATNLGTLVKVYGLAAPVQVEVRGELHTLTDAELHRRILEVTQAATITVAGELVAEDEQAHGPDDTDAYGRDTSSSVGDEPTTEDEGKPPSPTL